MIKEIETVIYHIPALNSSITINDVDTCFSKYFSKYKNYAFITAFNRKGIKDTIENNILNNKRLLNDIKEYHYLTAFTEFNTVIDEEGFMIFDIERTMLISLQEKYEQNAVLFGTIHCSELIYLI